MEVLTMIARFVRTRRFKVFVVAFGVFSGIVLAATALGYSITILSGLLGSLACNAAVDLLLPDSTTRREKLRRIGVLLGDNAKLIATTCAAVYWAMLGNANDLARWTAAATRYLRDGARGTFYAEPRTQLEQLSNNAALDALRAEQEACLSEFFERNHALHAALADELLHRRELDVVSLGPYLAKVVLPDGFPRLKGVS